MSTFQSTEEAREYFKKDVYAYNRGMVLDELGGQRKIQEEAAPGSQEADPSGKAWEDSPWAPSMTRDVPATAQQAEPLAFGPRPLGLLLWAPLHGWADCGQCTGWGRAWAQEADPLGSDPCSATCWVTLGRPFDLSVLWFLHLSRGDETVTYPKACL